MYKLSWQNNFFFSVTIHVFRVKNFDVLKNKILKKQPKNTKFWNQTIEYLIIWNKNTNYGIYSASVSDSSLESSNSALNKWMCLFFFFLVWIYNAQDWLEDHFIFLTLAESTQIKAIHEYFVLEFHCL